VSTEASVNIRGYVRENNLSLGDVELTKRP